MTGLPSLPHHLSLLDRLLFVRYASRPIVVNQCERETVQAVGAAEVLPSEASDITPSAPVVRK